MTIPPFTLPEVVCGTLFLVVCWLLLGTQMED